MKAIVVTKFGGPEVLEFKEVPKPKLGANQVMIRVEAAAVNFVDIKNRYGQHHSLHEPPYIPGVDVSGTIEQLGENVTNFNIGQRVCGFTVSGSYAEYAVLDSQLAFPLPDHVSFEIGASVPVVGLTSYMLFDYGGLKKGDSVLIHAAAGGVGTTAVQLAKILGAGKVIGTVGSDEKRDVVYKAGADHVINYQHENFVERVLEHTQGKGVQLILDPVAGDIGKKSLQCLAKFGRLINFGKASGESSCYHTDEIQSSCRTVMGFSMGSIRKTHPFLLKEPAEQLFKYLNRGDMEIFISSRFKLEDAVSAHRLIESRKSQGKIVLSV